MDFEDGILRPVWILSDGILSRRGKLRRDSEIEPKIRLVFFKELLLSSNANLGKKK